MTWRLAKSLIQLRNQINAISPNRNKENDGSIGDEAHASRSSDHNPWFKDEDGVGVVSAIDITNDPAHGIVSEELAEMLRASRDSRIKYIISNRKIASFDHGWSWRAYSGTNPHDHHVHISVRPERALYDSVVPWVLTLNPAAVAVSAPPAAAFPILRKGATGADVARLQVLLNKHGAVLKVDEEFGTATLAAVINYQTSKGLVADGVVGSYTWKSLQA
jgi:hypothetical protein